MALDELRNDLRHNMAEAASLDATPEALKRHLTQTLWPFLEALLDVAEEMDDALAEVVEQSEDYLQPETAAVIAGALQAGMVIAGELRTRLVSTKLADRKLLDLLAQHESLCAHAAQVIASVTVMNEGDEDDDDEDQDDAGVDAPAEETSNEGEGDDA